jgi:hypothetical protein
MAAPRNLAMWWDSWEVATLTAGGKTHRWTHVGPSESSGHHTHICINNKSNRVAGSWRNSTDLWPVRSKSIMVWAFLVNCQNYFSWRIFKNSNLASQKTLQLYYPQTPPGWFSLKKNCRLFWESYENMFYILDYKTYFNCNNKIL